MEPHPPAHVQHYFQMSQKNKHFFFLPLIKKQTNRAGGTNTADVFKRDVSARPAPPADPRRCGLFPVKPSDGAHTAH